MWLFCSLLPYGGPDGELGASLRYLSQRYTMPFPELAALLTDIGVEESSHACYTCGWLEFCLHPVGAATCRPFYVASTEMGLEYG